MNKISKLTRNALVRLIKLVELLSISRSLEKKKVSRSWMKKLIEV